MSEIFKDELKRLRIHFVEMGINVNEQIYRATKAFTSHDRALADQVLELDRQINDQEVTLEKQALKLMALQQPLANDFRLIISILKASNDIERLGDYASHIARSAKHVETADTDQAVDHAIDATTNTIRQMLEKVLDAFVNDNERAAYEVAEEDLAVDVVHVQQQKQILKKMTENQAAILSYEAYLAVLRNLERAGDHIVNLAEWVVYIQTGKLVELNPGKTDPKLVKEALAKVKSKN